MQNNKSLWPRFFVNKERLPQDLLVEQANELKFATNSLLEAEVDYSDTYEPGMLRSVLKFGDNNLGKASFFIIAPTLSNYRYKLFSVTYSRLEIYPILIISDLVEVKKVLFSEEELKDVLSIIFQSNETKEIVETLMIRSLQGMDVK